MNKPVRRTSNAVHAQRVLEALRQAQKPIGAYEIIAAVGDMQKLAPATVYRALDRLIRDRQVHKLQSLNAFVSCHHDDCCEQPAFAICNLCGCVTEFSACGLGAMLERSASAKSFTLDTATIELHGTCHDCQQRRQK